MWILMRDEKVRKGDAGWGVAFLNFRMKQNAPVTHFIACELLLAIIFLTQTMMDLRDRLMRRWGSRSWKQDAVRPLCTPLSSISKDLRSKKVDIIKKKKD